MKVLVIIKERVLIILNYSALLFFSISKIFRKDGGGFLNATALNSKYLLDLYYRRNYIFIHINKTGGSSISRFLGENEQLHLSAFALKNYLGTEVFNSKYRFAFVRNPYDRVVSQYHYRLENNQTNLKTKEVSFKEWVQLCYVEKNENYYNYPAMFQSQFNWLTDDDGVLLVDFVGKFENLERDFLQVCKQLNIEGKPLPHRRKSNREKSYLHYYDNETLNIISNKFEKDFKIFGYEKLTKVPQKA